MNIAVCDTQESSPPRDWYPAVMASLVLHLMLLAWLAGSWSGKAEAVQALAELQPPVPRLTLARGNPQQRRAQRSPAKAESAESLVTTSTTSEVTTLIETMPVETMPVETMPVETVLVETVPEPTRNDTVLLPEPLADLITPPHPQPVSELKSAIAGTAEARAGESDDSTYSAPALRAAITHYVRSRQPDLTSTWLEACRLHQKEHGTRACPQQAPRDYSGKGELRGFARQAFASVLHPYEEKQLLQQLMTSMARMKALLGTPGPTAELAANRFNLDRQRLQYLSGNVDYGIRGFRQANEGMQYDPTFLQALCTPAPCVFDYASERGPAAQREAFADGDDVGDRGEADDATEPFLLRQTLFGTSIRAR